MSILAFKRFSTHSLRLEPLQYTRMCHRSIRHSIFIPNSMRQTTESLRNCDKYPCTAQQISFHSSPRPRAFPLLPALVTMSKPSIIFTTKILLKFGRPMFLALRWIWFFIPRRFRSKIETFFYHRYFNKYSKWNFFAFLSTLWALGFYSYFSNLEEVPYSFRRRFSYMKMQDLYEESMQEAAGQLTAYQNRILSSSHPLHIEITNIVDKLSNAARINGILDMQFKIFVIDADVKNAFVLPNGNVFVFTGIVNVFNDINSLGILLGHEMAHVIAGHAAETACRESGILMIDAMIFMLLSLFIPSNYMFGIQEWFRLQMMKLLTDLPFSRMNETEADYIGLILAKQCGFNIEAGKTMWDKMGDEIGDNLPEIFSTHPNHENRSTTIKSWIKHIDCLGKHCTVF